MKRMIVYCLLLLTLCAADVSAQRQNAGAVKYYFDITRPDCCMLTDAKWRGIAAALQKSGIPTFFGLSEVTDYYQSWRPAAITRTVSDEGYLILGPFASAQAAVAALGKLPNLLPKEGENFRGVESGPTTTPQTWRVGMYQIDGFISSVPMTVKKPEVRQAGVMEAVVIERSNGASGYGIIVESGGVRYYIYVMGNAGTVKTRVGDIETPGNRVRITYSAKHLSADGNQLDATKIVQIK